MQWFRKDGGVPLTYTSSKEIWMAWKERFLQYNRTEGNTATYRYKWGSPKISILSYCDLKDWGIGI